MNCRVISGFIFMLSIMFSSCDVGKKNSYPEQDIDVVIFSSKGGSTDRWARHLSSIMEEEMGVEFMCENVPGDLGGIGAMKVWNRAHDGYTVLGGSESSIFFGINNVAPTAENWEFYIAGGSPGVLAVLKDSKFADISTLIKLAHQSPGKIIIGNSGIGKLWHIKAEQFAMAAGVRFTYAPFDGSGPAIQALLNRQVDVVSCSADEIYDLVRNGLVSVLIVNEMDGFEFDGYGYVESVTELFPSQKQQFGHLFQWVGFMLPADVPSHVKEKFDYAFMAALNHPKTTELMVQQKFQWMGVTGKEAKDIALKMEKSALTISKDIGVTKDDSKSQINPN